LAWPEVKDLLSAVSERMSLSKLLVQSPATQLAPTNGRPSKPKALPPVRLANVDGSPIVKPLPVVDCERRKNELGRADPGQISSNSQGGSSLGTNTDCEGGDQLK
jgi:hypothetical protein